jgi:hypothetical protein
MIGFACGFWLACLVCSRCLVLLHWVAGAGPRAAPLGRPERDRAGFGDMGSVPMWRWMLGIPRRAPPEVMGRSSPVVFPGAAQADGARAGGEQLGVDGPLPGVQTVP